MRVQTQWIFLDSKSVFIHNNKQLIPIGHSLCAMSRSRGRSVSRTLRSDERNAYDNQSEKLDELREIVQRLLQPLGVDVVNVIPINDNEETDFVLSANSVGYQSAINQIIKLSLNKEANGLEQYYLASIIQPFPDPRTAILKDLNTFAIRRISVPLRERHINKNVAQMGMWLAIAFVVAMIFYHYG